MQKIHLKIETFDFEDRKISLYETLRHLSLFAVCLHFLTCYRSCDKTSEHCFYCSRVRAHNFANHSHFFDIVVSRINDTYNEGFLYLRNKVVVLDVFLERPAYFDYPNFPLADEKCDYFQRFHHAQNLFVVFVGVLVRMYVNYLTEFFSKFELSIRDEEFVIKQIYCYASDLMHSFF